MTKINRAIFPIKCLQRYILWSNKPSYIILAEQSQVFFSSENLMAPLQSRIHSMLARIILAKLLKYFNYSNWFFDILKNMKWLFHLIALRKMNEIMGMDKKLSFLSRCNQIFILRIINLTDWRQSITLLSYSFMYQLTTKS